jgi:hypothetical protein
MSENAITYTIIGKTKCEKLKTKCEKFYLFIILSVSTFIASRTSFSNFGW